MYTFNQATIDPFGGVGISVTSPSGHDISPHYNPGGGSGAVIHLGPKQERQIEIKLSEFVKINEPGVYTITAKKDYILTGGKSAEAASNPLSISVVPAAKPAK